MDFTKLDLTLKGGTTCTICCKKGANRRTCPWCFDFAIFNHKPTKDFWNNVHKNKKTQAKLPGGLYVNKNAHKKNLDDKDLNKVVNKMNDNKEDIKTFLKECNHYPIIIFEYIHIETPVFENLVNILNKKNYSYFNVNGYDGNPTSVYIIRCFFYDKYFTFIININGLYSYL